MQTQEQESASAVEACVTKDGHSQAATWTFFPKQSTKVKGTVMETLIQQVESIKRVGLLWTTKWQHSGHKWWQQWSQPTGDMSIFQKLSAVTAIAIATPDSNHGVTQSQWQKIYGTVMASGDNHGHSQLASKWAFL